MDNHPEPFLKQLYYYLLYNHQQKYILFLEEFSNPLRIKSLRASSKNEVMNWQPF